MEYEPVLKLAVQPAEQDGDGARVMAEPVAGAEQHPQLDLPLGRVGQGPRVEQRHDLVVRPVDE